MLIKYLSPAGVSKLMAKIKANFAAKNHGHNLPDLSGIVPLNKGGTGAGDAAGARQNLEITPQNIGAAPSAHTHDAGAIASGVMPIIRGGTGAGNAAQALANLGGMPKSGGAFTGPISFDGHTIGLVWTTADGTTFSMRPYTNGNIFQITVRGPDTGNAEQPTFNITSGGQLELHRALPVGSGGTGAGDAAGARANLSVPEKRNGVVLVDNQKGIGTGDGGSDYWQLWNWESDTEPGTFPAAFAPAANGKQNLGTPAAYIGKVYALRYSGGTVESGTTFNEETTFRKRIYVDKNDGVSMSMSTGNNPQSSSVYLSINGQWTNALTLYPDKTTLTKPLDVASGGTGAASAAGARANLGIVNSPISEAATGLATASGSEKTISFGRTFAKPPVVFCSQNGGSPCAYKVTAITQTGFNLTANSGTDWRYIALVV